MITGILAAVQQTLPPDASADAAAGVASQMVGALQLARALGPNAEGRALLQAVRQSLLSLHDRGHEVEADPGPAEPPSLKV